MSSLDKGRLWLAAIMVVGGLYWGFHGLATEWLGWRVLATLGGPLLAVVLVLFSDSGRTFLAYCRAATTEVRKVVWPKREETIRMTGVVLAFVAIVAIFLWLVDFIIVWLISLLAQ